MKFNKEILLKLFNYWPPYLGAGVKLYPNKDLTEFTVKLRSYPWNKNYVGVHFGGSLYSMCDPFFMLILMHRLGPGFIVWDKAASIQFKRPGKGTVTARFVIDDERVEQIRNEALSAGKCEPEFDVDVIDAKGEVVASVHKVLWVRPKDRKTD
jgi:hypothetical protein